MQGFACCTAGARRQAAQVAHCDILLPWSLSTPTHLLELGHAVAIAHGEQRHAGVQAAEDGAVGGAGGAAVGRAVQVGGDDQEAEEEDELNGQACGDDCLAQVGTAC